MVVQFDGKGHPGSLVRSSSLHRPPFIPAQSSLRAQRKRSSNQEKAENWKEYFSKCFSSPPLPPSPASLWPTPITEQQGKFSLASAGVSVFSIGHESNHFALLCPSLNVTPLVDTYLMWPWRVKITQPVLALLYRILQNLTICWFLVQILMLKFCPDIEA